MIFCSFLLTTFSFPARLTPSLLRSYGATSRHLSKTSPPSLLRSYGATSRHLSKTSPPSRVALRRGTSLPLRVRLCLALRLAEPKLSFAERRLVEVGGVEPPSEAALTKLLRVYSAFDLARGMPTDGLIPKQPLGCTWARRANGALQAKSC